MRKCNLAVVIFSPSVSGQLLSVQVHVPAAAVLALHQMLSLVEICDEWQPKLKVTNINSLYVYTELKKRPPKQQQ